MQIEEALDLGVAPDDDMILASYFTLLLRYHRLLPYEGESRTASYLRLKALADQAEPLELFPELERDLEFAYHQEVITLLISGYTYRGAMPMSVALIPMLKLRRKVAESEISPKTQRAVRDSIKSLGKVEHRERRFRIDLIPDFVRVLAGEGVIVENEGDFEFREFRHKVDTLASRTMPSGADVGGAPSSRTVAAAQQIIRVAKKKPPDVIEPMAIIDIEAASPQTERGMQQAKPQREVRRRISTILGQGRPNDDE